MILFLQVYRVVSSCPIRKLLLGTLTFIFFFTILSLCMEYFSMHKMEARFYKRHIMLLKRARSAAGGKLISTCNIPDNDPFDFTVMRYFEHFTLQCSDDPYLLFVDKNGFLHLNKTGFDAINKTFDQINCTYNCISGVDGQKRILKYGRLKIVHSEPNKIECDFICTKCHEGSKIIYKNCHFYVPPPNDTLRQKNKRLREKGKSNVLLLAIDSTSRLRFIRNLPKTYEFLTKRLNSVVMRGLNKVGLNTHPNMIPFLSGYSMYKQKDNPTPAFCTNTSICSGYYDNLPIVWNNFSQAGYVTMFCDEWLETQLFHYDAKGFKHVPTDYYPRPLIQGLEASFRTKLEDFCYGNTPTHEVLLDYTEQFTKAMENTIYFAFTFITRISHDDDYGIQSLDDSLERTLEKLYTTGVFNNTILVLFGDHGRRFGRVRNTLIGALEDRMPFMSIYLPRRLREQKPHLQAALEVNSARLLSWFDMYEMLMDLAMDNLEEVSRVTRWGFHVGLSPLRPLPENRTCQQIGVPPEYCVCMTPLDIDVTEEGVLETAAHIVDHVNSKLRRVPGKPCAELSLHKIESAQVLSNPQDVMTPNGLIEYLRVTISTVPGHALLQATSVGSASYKHLRLQGEVERLNKYRHQADCVHWYPDNRIHPYCFCTTNDTEI